MAPSFRPAPTPAMAAARPPCLLIALAPRGAPHAKGSLDALSEPGPTGAASLVRALSEPTYHHLLPSADALSELTRASTALPVTLSPSSRHSDTGCLDVPPGPLDISGPWAMHGPSAVRRAESAPAAVSKRRHRRIATTARVMVTHGRRCPLNHPHRRSTPLGPRWSGHDSRPRRDPRGASEPQSGGDGSEHRNAVRLALRRARRPREVHR